MKNFWLNRELRLWEIHDGEKHWYAASSKEDALRQHVKEFGIAEEEIDKIIQINDDIVLPVREAIGDYILRQTAKEWCLDIGRGLVGSTAY